MTDNTILGESYDVINAANELAALLLEEYEAKLLLDPSWEVAASMPDRIRGIAPFLGAAIAAGIYEDHKLEAAYASLLGDRAALLAQLNITAISLLREVVTHEHIEGNPVLTPSQKTILSQPLKTMTKLETC